MQQLTGLDAAFLALETPNSTGHVGGVCVLDPTGAARPLDLATLTELIAQRLPVVPVMRRRLLEVPFGLDQPYWVDDPDFDLEYHTREIALPQPGSYTQLAEQVARLHARPLDPSPPALGDVSDHRIGRRSHCDLLEGSPRCDRRSLRRRTADGAA